MFNPLIILRKISKICGLFLIIFGLVSCAGVSVQRNDAATQRDLSGKWNANDSRLVSKKMINSMLTSPWIDNARRVKKGKPTLIVGQFRNLSHEIIAIDAFVSDIEKALVDSDEVQFVANATQRGQLRNERNDQEFNASDATRKESGQETGADFLLTGTINSFVDQSGGTKNIQYQIDMELLDIASNKKIWLETQQHGKTISRSKFGL